MWHERLIWRQVYLTRFFSKGYPQLSLLLIIRSKRDRSMWRFRSSYSACDGRSCLWSPMRIRCSTSGFSDVMMCDSSTSAASSMITTLGRIAYKYCKRNGIQTFKYTVMQKFGTESEDWKFVTAHPDSRIWKPRTEYQRIDTACSVFIIWGQNAR